MPPTWLFLTLLGTLLAIALACDAMQRRIPNWLIVAGLGVGFGCSLGGVPGWPSPGRSLLGALTGLATLLPLYALRTMGAGDAKLMAAVGSFLGPLPVLGAALLTFAAGGVLALATALGSGSLAHVLGNLRLIGLILISGRSTGISPADVQTTGRLPYAIAIATGTALQLWLATQEGWVFA